MDELLYYYGGAYYIGPTVQTKTYHVYVVYFAVFTILLITLIDPISTVVPSKVQNT